MPGDRVCWNLVIQLTAKESEEEQFRNSEWGPEANKSMIKSVAHFKTPYGTLGELINATPKETVSRVFLEDMLYQTWHHDRTVLIGDGKHFKGLDRRQLRTPLVCWVTWVETNSNLFFLGFVVPVPTCDYSYSLGLILDLIITYSFFYIRSMPQGKRAIPSRPSFAHWILDRTLPFHPHVRDATFAHRAHVLS